MQHHLGQEAADAPDVGLGVVAEQNLQRTAVVDHVSMRGVDGTLETAHTPRQPEIGGDFGLAPKILWATSLDRMFAVFR